MNQHTEGPWFVDGNSIAHQSGDIATLDGVRPYEEEEANARLIAAAPELLEACRDAAIRLEVGNSTDNPTYRQLEAAIAKAESMQED